MSIKDQPFISVIMPVYNTEKYISNTILSLAQQTFQDFEVILVDDETRDNAVDIAQNLLRRKSISYRIVHQKNCGQGESRNNGVKRASGKWLLFLDSDDTLQPDTFELMNRVVVQNNDINFVFTDYQIVTIGNEFKEASYNNGFQYLSRSEIQDGFLIRKKVILAPGTLYNAEWYKRNNLYFKKIPFSEDQLFIWEMLLSVEKVVNIRKPLYNYLKRSGSIMSSTKLNAVVKGYSEFKKIQENYFQSTASTELTKRYLLSRWVLGVFHSGAKLIDKNEYKYLLKCFDAKTHCFKMLKFPSYKVKLIAIMILLFPNISYLILKRI